MRAWACVYTHPQAERFADANLRRMGYETYLPLVIVRRRDRAVPTMLHEVQLPAFPRYLFLRHDPGEPVSPIWYAPGVRRLLGRNGEEMDHATDGEIRLLQAVLAFPRAEIADKAEWPVGSACRLIAGPFRGREVVVSGRNGHFVRCTLPVGTALATIQVTPNYLAARDEG